MSVTIPDSAAQAALKYVERRVKELPGERLQAIVLGNEKDEEIEALATLYQALRAAARRNRPVHANGSRSIAIGRHAYDYLTSSNLPQETRAALAQAVPRRTLVGVSFTNNDQIRQCIEVLLAGTGEAASELEQQRFEQTARRMEVLLKSDDQQQVA